MAVRFSILVPTYNRAEYVRQAVESILAQTFTDYELLVIDDGSSDETPQLLAAYGSRIRALHQANQGPEMARNQGAALAEGEYLVLLDSDDRLMPWALATYDHVIRALNSPPVIIGSMKYFQGEDPILTESDGAAEIEVCRFPDYLAKTVPVGLSNSRIVLRRSLFEEVGGLRHSTPATFHLDDFNLVLKTGTYGPCVIVKAPTTVAYRLHESNSIRGVEAMARGILALVAAERAGEYPGGKSRRFARYACIGGIAQLWTIQAVKCRQFGIAAGLLRRTAPMIVAAVMKKFFSLFRSSPTELIAWGSRNAGS